MPDPSLAALADTIDELATSLEAHVKEARLLVLEAERAERVTRACDSLMTRIGELRRQTGELRAKVKDNRDQLYELRGRMRRLVAPRQ
jgi:hypothetical protein